MKVSEIRKLERNELVEKCNTSIEEYKKIKFALKSGGINPENVNKARELKRDIARYKTILKELALLETETK